MSILESESAPGKQALALRRRLSLFDVLCIGVNAIVGSGVFAIPDDMHRQMGGYSPLSFLLCALLLMPVALCFAELSGRHEETGGSYLYARNAFGDKIGFFVGWFCWANAFVSWAANITLFVELAGLHTFPYNKLVAVTAVLLLGVINYIGVKPGAMLVNLVVIGKLSAIFCFIGVAIFAFNPSKLGGTLPLGMAGVGQGIYLALFPLQGFEVVPVTAGETKNPRRNVPLGTLGALFFSAILFVIVQALMSSVYPDIAKPSDTPLAEAARYLGPILGTIVLVGGIVSVGGFSAGSALGSPRYAQAIAAHGLLPARLSELHPRFGTPHIAIIFTSLASAFLAAFFDYRKLVGMSNLAIVVQYVFTCLAVPVLRRLHPLKSDSYRIPGGPIIPLIGAVGSLGFLLPPIRGALRREPDSLAEMSFAALALVLGVLVFAFTRRAPKKLG